MPKKGTQIVGVDQVLKNLSRKQREALEANNAEARVGYTANYAVFVHENLDIKHPMHGSRDCGGKAKFLEDPARELNNSGELGSIISRAIKGGAKLQQALYLAALRIQRESQLQVPVDTGNLRGSAFTRAGKS